MISLEKNIIKLLKLIEIQLPQSTAPIRFLRRDFNDERPTYTYINGEPETVFEKTFEYAIDNALIKFQYAEDKNNFELIRRRQGLKDAIFKSQYNGVTLTVEGLMMVKGVRPEDIGVQPQGNNLIDYTVFYLRKNRNIIATISTIIVVVAAILEILFYLNLLKI